MTDPALAIADSTRIRFHTLQFRPDGSDWVVGRLQTGEFIAVPEAGYRAIELLESGATVAECHIVLYAETGDDLDVADYVCELVDLGFVAAVNGQPLTAEPLPPTTLRWLTPAHTRWTLHWSTAAVIGALVLVALGVLLTRRTALPGYHDLIWHHRTSVVILGNAAVGWAIVFLHELAHLCTARAAGSPARMSVGSRLQFLVVQTDVSGVWAADRRTRLTVYLSGIAVNLAVGSAGILVGAATTPETAPHRAAAATTLSALVPVTIQFLVFMRTDLYFVLQDLTGARNLYADGTAYLRHRARRLRRGAAPAVDPTNALPRRERTAVRAYSAMLLLGTATCLAVAAVITMPAILTVLSRAIRSAATTTDLGQLADATTTLLVIGTFQALWLYAWWRRHHPSLRRRPRPAEERR